MNIFDWKYYTSIYHDLQKAGIDTREKALQHWNNHGKKENRKCNDFECFDYNFYIKTYPDLQFTNINDAYNHWINFGRNEKRVCCLNKMKQNMEQFIKIANEQNLKYNKIKQTEEKINILIRTSNRPEYFRKCIESVLSQNYKNYRVIVGYDKIESLEYLKDYDMIDKYEMKTTSKERFKHNLYLNTMMDKVQDGFIMYLDDDDMMAHNNSLNIINDNITNEKDLIIWKFMRPDKLIYPDKIIRLGHISGCAYTFNSKYKLKSRWVDRQCSDYYFITKLLKNTNLNIKKIDYILTRIISDDRIGNFGK